MWGGDYMMGWGGGWGWWWPMHMLMWVLFVVVLIVLFRWVLESTRGGGGSHGRADSAMTILCERFARGEIDATEFDERMKLLKGSAKKS